jgi:hypothetical protein
VIAQSRRQITMTDNTPKTPMTARRKQLLFGTITAALVAACVVPIAAYAALDDGRYCVTAVSDEGEFQGNKGACPAEPGAPGTDIPTVPTDEPAPVETVAPLPETTPEDPASCDLDAANSAAEDLFMRAMFSDKSSAINSALRSSVYDNQPSVAYQTPTQTTTLTVDRRRPRKRTALVTASPVPFRWITTTPSHWRVLAGSA